MVDEATFVLPLEGVIDIAGREGAPGQGRRDGREGAGLAAGRLGNPSFVERAKPEAVEKARADHDERVAEVGEPRAALARLG